jgi:hypothetical protein
VGEVLDDPIEAHGAFRFEIAGAPPLYVRVRARLALTGWAQGVERDRRGAESLSTAVREVVAALESTPARRAVREARARNHLRRLASTSNLDHWNDAPDRFRRDVDALLLDAAVAFPSD